MFVNIHQSIAALFVGVVCIVMFGCDTTKLTTPESESDSQTPDPSMSQTTETSTTLTWDWREDESFKDWDGNQIPAPWYQEFHMGVDLAEANRCQPSDGWALYIKRMEASDWNTKEKSQDTAPENPYFALYNRYTGVLRLFMYMGGNNTIGEDYFTINNRIQYTVGSTADAGLFLQDAGDYSYPLSEKSANLNENKINFFQFEAVYKKWIVLDYVLSYDPTLSSYENMILRVGIGAVDTSKIQLEGEFNYEEHEVTRGRQNIIGALVDDVFGSSGKIKRRMNDLTRFKDNLEDIENDFENHSGILGDVASSLGDFASFIDPTLGTIGFAYGVVDYINSFTNIFGGGSAQTEVTIGRGSMHLAGTITNDFNITFHKIGLPLVQYTEEGEAPDFQENVGLFSMKQKPEVTVLRKQFHYDCRNDRYDFYSQYSSYGLYLQFDDSNMKDLFRVNPASNMQLTDVQALPIIKVKGPFLSFNYFPTYDVIYKEGLEARDYSYDLKIYAPTGTYHRFRPTYTLPESSYYVDGHLIAGADSNEFPDQVTTLDGVECQDGLRPKGVDVDMRFYLKFENANNAEIKTEFMRTYKPKITYEDVFEF